MDMPYRVLGRTGERVSAIGLGGWHLSLKHVEEPLSIRVIRTAIDHGINFLDNSWDYNEGKSELRMGKALKGSYREKAFPFSRPARPASCATSASPATRTRTSTCTCSRWHGRTGSRSIPPRCRST